MSLLPAVRRLVICAPPRCGSETLCAMLEAAGLGVPREYLNPTLYPIPAPQDPGAVIAALTGPMRQAAAQGGVFAIKVQGWQLRASLLNPVGRELFEGAHVVWLTAADMRRQVISHAAAMLTRDWYRARREVEAAAIDAARLALRYAESMRFILAEAAIFARFFAQSGIVPQAVVNTSLFADPDAVLRAIASGVGRTLPEPLVLPAETLAPYSGQAELRARLAAIAGALPFGGVFDPPPAAPRPGQTPQIPAKDLP